MISLSQPIHPHSILTLNYQFVMTIGFKLDFKEANFENFKDFINFNSSYYFIVFILLMCTDFKAPY